MKVPNIYFTLFFVFLNVSICYGQNIKDLEKELAVYFKKVEGNVYDNVTFKSVAKRITSKDTICLNFLKENETNKLYLVRYNVFNFYKTIGTYSTDTLFRREMNNNILRCTLDTINANPDKNLNNFIICENIFDNYDKYFRKNDFDKSFKKKLIEIVKTKKEIKSNLVLFIGWLEIKETIPSLKLLLEKGKKDADFELPTYLALTRMGEKRYYEKTIDKIKKNISILTDF
jgi:hypothetical protein